MKSCASVVFLLLAVPSAGIRLKAAQPGLQDLISGAQSLLGNRRAAETPEDGELKKASVTAINVANARALAYSTGGLDDWVSACFATTGYGEAAKGTCSCKGKPAASASLWQDAIAQQGFTQVAGATGFLLDLQERTKSLDSVIRKLGSFDQVVFLGAGFDGRPYRMEALASAKTIFEMDLKETQALKQRLVEDCQLSPANGEGGLEFMNLNLLEQEPFEKLKANPRFNQNAKTLYVQEHVAQFLPAEGNAHWVQKLRELSQNPDDRLVMMSLRVMPGFSPESMGKNKIAPEETSQFYFASSKSESDGWMAENGWTGLDGFESDQSSWNRVNLIGYIGAFKPQQK